MSTIAFTAEDVTMFYNSARAVLAVAGWGKARVSAMRIVPDQIVVSVEWTAHDSVEHHNRITFAACSDESDVRWQVLDIIAAAMRERSGPAGAYE